MNIESVIKEYYSLRKNSDIKTSRDFLYSKIKEAKEKKNNQALLILYNEAMGLCREMGDAKGALDAIKHALKLCERLKLINTIPHATTLLNAANAYRAVGDIADSLVCYERVIDCYRGKVSDTDMLYANLYNNLSLLKQEMNDFESSKEYLQKALHVVKSNQNTEFEEATTYANLSNSCAMLGEINEAKVYGKTAVAIFKQNGIEDVHYAAALNGLGNCAMMTENYREAADYFNEAAEIIKKLFGETPDYDRVIKNMKDALNAQQSHPLKGMELCKKYYEAYGEIMLKTKFKKYFDQITVGLVGEGSDCYGLDDEASRDHDWGPGFCIWVSRSLYKKIGKDLEKAYDNLPKEYLGFKRTESAKAKGRVGVLITEDYYKDIIGPDFSIEDDDDIEKSIDLNMAIAEDYSLAACVNGEIFHEGKGKFMLVRNKLLKGYPFYVRLMKIAQSAALFSQGAQYNYARMKKRGDIIGANISIAEGLKNALKILYYIDNKYPLHDKWLAKGSEKIITGKYRDASMQIVVNIEKIFEAISNPRTSLDAAILIQRTGEMIAQILYEEGLISKVDGYLDVHTDEIIALASFAAGGKEALCEQICVDEYAAFDKVINEGGRAGCQDDWMTFRIMRMSQYMTYTMPMLVRYRYDFNKAYAMGRNLISEKYARMEESTAPKKYEELKKHLPIITDEQRKVVEAIVAIQVEFMEEMAKEYPNVVRNARTIHTKDDRPFNTSYETYLRGELLTYSDSMLMMYGRYVIEHASMGNNIAKEIMTNTAKLYGFKSIDELN